MERDDIRVPKSEERLDAKNRSRTKASNTEGIHRERERVPDLARRDATNA